MRLVRSEPERDEGKSGVGGEEERARHKSAEQQDEEEDEPIRGATLKTAEWDRRGRNPDWPPTRTRNSKLASRGAASEPEQSLGALCLRPTWPTSNIAQIDEADQDQDLDQEHGSEQPGGAQTNWRSLADWRGANETDVVELASCPAKRTRARASATCGMAPAQLDKTEAMRWPLSPSSSTRSRRRPTSEAEQVARPRWSRPPPAARSSSLHSEARIVACDPGGPHRASNRKRNNDENRGGGGNSNWRRNWRPFEFQLARWLALALFVRELLPHLAAVQWSEFRTPPTRLTPLASPVQRHFQAPGTHELELESEPIASAAALNNLINWRPLRAGALAAGAGPSRAEGRLQSMFVSLFALPLCQANELAGSRPPRDKGQGRDGGGARPRGVAAGRRIGQGNEAAATGANVAASLVGGGGGGGGGSGGQPTGDEQTEIPINLPATRGTTWDRAAAASTRPLPPPPPPPPSLSLKLEQLLESGQNNSNNNNNNETAASAVAGANGRPQSKQAQLATGANSQHLPRPTSQTGAAQSGAASEASSTPYAARAGRHGGGRHRHRRGHSRRRRQTYDPNLAPSQLAGKTAERATANLTMTMTGASEQEQEMHAGGGGLKQNRARRSGPDEPELKRRPMTTATATATVAANAAVATSRRQPDSSARPRSDDGDKSAQPMNSVVCNSRCQCVQLEFAGSELAGDDDDKKATSVSVADQPMGCSKTSGSSLGANSEGPAKCDGDDEAAGEFERGGEQSSGNRIALIEFSQDYSLDEEPDERRADSGESDAVELPPTSTTPPPSTTTTTTTTSTTTTTTPNTTTTGNKPEEERPGQQHHPGAPGPTAGASPSSSWPLPPPPTAAAASDVDRAAGHQNVTIRPDDQSKVVNAPEAPGDGRQREDRQRQTEPPAATAAMLSIKDNKIGVPPTQAATDKEQPAAAAARAKGATYQKVASFYPFLADLHHLRQRHQLPDHQIGPHAAGLPRTGPNSLAFLADSKSRPLESRELHLDQLGPIRRILPLRTRSINDTKKLNEPSEWADLIEDIKRRQLQSISLRSSKLKFELWTEIYGLLAVELRRNIIHLDLSGNELVKLGVTFTGYIEHHLAFQLLANQNQLWPFSSSGQHQTGATTGATAATTTTPTSMVANGSIPAPNEQTAPGSTSSSRRPQARHPILGSGELFNQVRARLPIDWASILLAAESSNTTYSNEQQLNKLAQKPFRHQQQQQLHSLLAQAQQTPTILHQASRLKALDLSHNKLKWLINDQFRVLKHVESIRLDHNQIRFIHQQAFNGLEALKYLNLNQNRLQTIYIEQFQTNYNLLALSIKSNYLTFLRAGSLASQNRLKRLDLSKNKFTYLSNNAFVGLDSLRLLNLSSNQFVHVPSTSFHSLAASLEELDMSRNLLTQLAPGTFFHLNLQRILLENNDQLVAIDRGAFWDLPHLRQLSLKSNPMLINVNSQAFVGLPKVQVVNYDDCQLLDDDTRQKLANLTTSAASKPRHQHHEHMSVPPGVPPPPTPTVSPMKLASASRRQLHGEALRGLQQVGTSIDEELLHEARWTMKYVYSMGCVVLVVVVLKLLFKYTSTRHYLGARRRRRRIYQTTTTAASNPSTLTSSTLTQSNSSLSERTGGDGDGGHFEEDDDQVESKSASSLNDCDDSLEDSNKCNSFAMYELGPRCESVGDQLGEPTGSNSTSPIELVEPNQVDGANGVMGTGGVEFGLEQQQQQQHQHQEQDQQEQPTSFENCPDCCNASTNAGQLDMRMENPDGQAQICDSTSGTNLESAQMDMAAHDGQCHITMDNNNNQLVCNHQHCTGSYEPFASNTNQSVPPPAISQLANHWANQEADCGLFRCACSRCVGAGLVGVNGYI